MLTTQYALDDARRRLAKYPDTEAVFIEDTFASAVPSIKEKMDFVYLDASHNYEPTLNELRLIDGILNEGGIIIGDDWQPDPEHKHHGVYRAVNKFVKESAYEFVAAGRGGQWSIRRETKYPG